jgi:hypothetical protein
MVHDKILALATDALEKQNDPPVAIEAKEVRGAKTWHLQPRGPVALDPGWGIVDGRLVVAAAFQGLKAHIARDGKKSLGQLPAVAARLQSGPITISYQDTLGGLRKSIGALQTFGPLLIGQLTRVGITVEMPTLPDLEPLESDILPRIDTTRQTESGLESESFSTVPFALRGVRPADRGKLRFGRFVPASARRQGASAKIGSGIFVGFPSDLAGLPLSGR